MSIELTNFTKRYEQAVNSIKTMKTINQRLQDKSSIDMKQQQANIESAKRKAQMWIIDMQKQYLDPQTSRRVDIVKQQLSAEYAKYKSMMAKSSKTRASTTQSNSNRDLQQEISASEDEHGQAIFKQFDHEHESSLMRQRSKQLSQAHSKLQNIHTITQDTQKLTYQQGEYLDIIDENITNTLTNTKESNSYLEEANKEQQKGQRKYMWLFGIAAIVVIVFIVIFLLLI